MPIDTAWYLQELGKAVTDYGTTEDTRYRRQAADQFETLCDELTTLLETEPFDTDEVPPSAVYGTAGLYGLVEAMAEPQRVQHRSEDLTGVHEYGRGAFDYDW